MEGSKVCAERPRTYVIEVSDGNGRGTALKEPRRRGKFFELVQTVVLPKQIRAGTVLREEVAEAFGVTTRTIDGWVRKGYLSPTWRSLDFKKVYFDYYELRQCIADHGNKEYSRYRSKAKK